MLTGVRTGVATTIGEDDLERSRRELSAPLASLALVQYSAAMARFILHAKREGKILLDNAWGDGARGSPTPLSKADCGVGY